MKLKGVSTSPQIVIGEVMQYVPFTCEVEPRQLEDHKAAEEVGLYQRAKEAAFLELSVLGEILEKKESSNTDFVAAHQEILNDPVMDQESTADDRRRSILLQTLP